MFVRLAGPQTGRGAVGKWTDAATGEHGDLLDVIRESCGLVDFKDVVDEARSFLSLPQQACEVDDPAAPAKSGSHLDRATRRGGSSR